MIKKDFIIQSKSISRIMGENTTPNTESSKPTAEVYVVNDDVNAVVDWISNNTSHCPYALRGSDMDRLVTIFTENGYDGLKQFFGPG